MSNKTETHLGFSLMIVAAVVALDVGICKTLESIYGGSATHVAAADQSVEERIKPVGQLNTGAAIVPAQAPVAEAAAPADAGAAPAAAARSGKEVYDTACFVCHTTGAAGAPVLGNAEAWAPRIAAGMDAMMNSALNGKNAMPPRGTCGNCSDDELRAAVEYMVESSQ